MLMGPQAQSHAEKHVYTYTHTNPDTHNNFYTQKPVHTKKIPTEDFSHSLRHFYTQTLLHTEALTL